MKKQIVSVGFDGTVVTHDFPKIGEDIGAVPVLKKLVDNGHKIILATVRSNTDSGYHVGPHLDNAVQWYEATACHSTSP